MKDREKFHKGSGPLISIVLLLFLLISSWLGAQEVGHEAAQPAHLPSGQQTAGEKPGGEAQPPPAEKETKNSSREAEEPFSSVDEIIKFSRQESAVPIPKQVKRRV